MECISGLEHIGENVFALDVIIYLEILKIWLFENIHGSGHLVSIHS